MTGTEPGCYSPAVANPRDQKPDDDVAGVNPQAVYIGGESIADRIVPHIKKILVVVGIGSVVIMAVLVYRWWSHRAAEKETAAMIEAIVTARAQIAAPAAPAATPDPEAPVTFATTAERAQAVLAELQQASGDPREGARLLEASMLLEAGRLDEAEQAYRKLTGKKGLEGVLAREGVAFVAEARAQAAEGDARTAALEAALEAYRATQPDDGGPRRDYALYHEGRILAQLGKKEEARAAFDKALDVVRADPHSDLELLVEMRLTQLDAPAVAMTPPAPTPAGDDKPAPAPAPDEAPAP